MYTRMIRHRQDGSGERLGHDLGHRTMTRKFIFNDFKNSAMKTWRAECSYMGTMLSMMLWVALGMLLGSGILQGIL